MRFKPVAELGREANARGAIGPWRTARADYCAGRLRLLLASSSLAALLIGSGAPAAVAAPNCKVIQNGGSVATVPNSLATGNCILVEGGANVSGNVINTSTGVLTTNGVTSPSLTGITISNSTVGGSVSNAGKIVAQSQGIVIDNNAVVSGGISNSGIITAPQSDIVLTGIPTFTGNISNAGSLTSNFDNGIAINGDGAATLFDGSIVNSGMISAQGDGLNVGSVSTFTGGISNSGTITAHFNGIAVVDIGQFGGGIDNSGTISAHTGIYVSNITQFGSSAAGGITNSGTITAGVNGIVVGGNIAVSRSSNTVSVTISTFAGRVSNSGTILAGGNGILVGGVATVASGTGYTASVTISTVAGGISNSGTISAAGAGILVGGVATVAGGTGNTASVTISTFAGGISNSGVISAGGNGIWVGGNVNVGGIFNPTSVTISTFSGGISNSGMISAGGNGIWVGGNVNVGGTFNPASVTIATFAEGITSSGVISAGGAGIWVGGTITVGGADNSVSGPMISTFSGGISNSGAIIAKTGIVVGLEVATFIGAIVNSGIIVGTGGTAIDVSFGPNNMTIDILGGSISGNILGSGTGNGDTVNFDLGSGTFTYDSDIVSFETVNVNSGTAVLNGSDSAAAFNVNSGGTLAGNGTLDPGPATTVTVNSGGTLEPGTPGVAGGTLTIDGTLTFNANSYYAINVAPGAGNASKTDVNGTATLNGNGTVEVAAQIGHYSNAVYQILVPTTLSGTFAGEMTNGDFVGGTPTLDYTTNPGDVDLDMTGSSLIATPPGANTNQQNVIDGINNAILNWPVNTSLPSQFVSVSNLTGSAFLNALSQLDGEDATGAETSAFQQMTGFLNLMLDPNATGGSGGGGPLGFAPDQASLPPDIALAYASILKAPPPTRFAQRWSAWGSAYGGSSTSDGNAAIGSNNLTASDYGFAGGMEYHVDPSTLYGFALSGGGLNWGLANALGTGRGDVFQGGVYGKHYFGAAYVSGAFGLGDDWFSTNRMALGEDLTASFAGQSYALRLEGGYRYALPAAGSAAGVTPYAALQTQWFHTPAYSESGGVLALAYSSQTANDTRTELGARFDDLTTLDATPLILRAKLAWAHDFVSDPSLGAAFQTLPGSAFTVNGAPIPHDTALTSAGAQWLFTPNWSFEAKFDGDFASGYALYAGTGTLRYTW